MVMEANAAESAEPVATPTAAEVLPEAARGLSRVCASVK